MEEVSLTIDEAKLKKMADEMLRQRLERKFCFSNIHGKDQPLVHGCQRDLEAPSLSLINQDLLYLKKGSSGSEKIVLLLHKFPAIIFNGDDIEERTSRWVNKCVKKFNPYARYGVEHWKNPHAKIFYIRKKIQIEPGNTQGNDLYELIRSLSYQDILGNWVMNNKFFTVDSCKSLVIWERVHDFQLGIESYQQKVNLTAPTISFPGVEKQKIELTNDEVEYLKLFEEEIKVRLKYRNQMRRWDMYVNGRPLGPRREHPE
ncbi:hypothetical protein Tco_1059498 [Tanacetum coccineum]